MWLENFCKICSEKYCFVDVVTVKVKKKIVIYGFGDLNEINWCTQINKLQLNTS